MTSLLNLISWPAFKNQASSATVYEPIISSTELDKKIQAFKSLTDPIFAGLNTGSCQIIGRRIIQLSPSSCLIKIEYDSGIRLRLSTKIPLNFNYFELSEEDKLKFNEFLLQQEEYSQNPFLTPNLTYSSSKPNHVSIKCLGYCMDDLCSTPEEFKKTLEDWDNTMTQLKKNLPDWKKNKPLLAEFGLRKKYGQVSVNSSIPDFFKPDQLCIDTFKLIPQLKQIDTALELRVSNLDPVLTRIGEKCKTGAIFFLGYLNETNCFSSLEPDISEQNFIKQAIDNNAGRLKIKNNSDSFSNPEYRTETFALTYVAKDPLTIKSDYEEFLGSVKKMLPAFEYQK